MIAFLWHLGSSARGACTLALVWLLRWALGCCSSSYGRRLCRSGRVVNFPAGSFRASEIPPFRSSKALKIPKELGAYGSVSTCFPRSWFHGLHSRKPPPCRALQGKCFGSTLDRFSVTSWGWVQSLVRRSGAIWSPCVCSLN